VCSSICAAAESSKKILNSTATVVLNSIFNRSCLFEHNSDTDQMEDVIELGEDGSFDIATTPVKQKSFIPENYDEFAATSSSSSFLDSVTAKSFLENISAGEYKIYATTESDVKVALVIIRLSEGEELALVEIVQANILALHASSKRVYSFNLNIDGCSSFKSKDITVKTLADIVCVRIPYVN